MKKETLLKRTPLLAEMVEHSAASVKRMDKKISSGDTESISYKAENQLSKNISNTVNAIKTEIFLYRTLTDKV